MTIKFQSETHERDFRGLLSKMKSKDCYHKAAQQDVAEAAAKSVARTPPT